jgi:hypothetical protein
MNPQPGTLQGCKPPLHPYDHRDEVRTHGPSRGREYDQRSAVVEPRVEPRDEVIRRVEPSVAGSTGSRREPIGDALARVGGSFDVERETRRRKRRLDLAERHRAVHACEQARLVEEEAHAETTRECASST